MVVILNESMHQSDTLLLYREVEDNQELGQGTKVRSFSRANKAFFLSFGRFVSFGKCCFRKADMFY